MINEPIYLSLYLKFGRVHHLVMLTFEVLTWKQMGIIKGNKSSKKCKNETIYLSLYRRSSVWFLRSFREGRKKSLLRRSKKPNLLQKLVSVRPNQIWHTLCHIYNNKEYLKGKVSQNLKFMAKMMPYMMLFFEVLTWKSHYKKSSDRQRLKIVS